MFQKGHARIGGRKKGKLNGKTIEIAKFSRDLFANIFKDPRFQESITRQIVTGKNPHVALELLKYAYGKPPDKVALTGEIGVTVSGDTALNKLASRLASLATRIAPAPGIEPPQSSGT
jgi:hypothetical protein